MAQGLKLFDVVALTTALPGKNLPAGQVGTVVEELGKDAVEVEFVANSGRTYAMVPVQSKDLIVLHYEPASAK